MTMKPEFSLIETSFSVVKTFIPVAPLSLQYIYNPTFIMGKEDKIVMLFIKEVPDKDNFVLIIDLVEGNPKEMNIEELAHQLNCHKKNDIFNLIDPNRVDQVIFICFDESKSMKWKLEGKNPIHNEMTRANLASEFLKTLDKQSYSLRVSSFNGLISFGSEVKIQQPLTTLTSQFINSLEQINPHGKTLLYDAINTAQHEIINLIKDKNGNNLYPNSRLRIIVITDGSDIKSETLPETLINELIQNDIVVDTVLVSYVDRSEDCCAISKLAGGLYFRPKNLEEGIQIFEQEAFLNIKIRHMNPLPYDQITSEIFTNEIKKINQYFSYTSNQMIINANSKLNLATPKYMLYIKMKKRISKFRIFRSFIVLNYIDKNPNDSYVVYSLYSTPEEWRIFIKGPKNTPFYNKWLILYMVIPSNYPNEPPQFRFLTIPFHPNMSSEGKVIFSLNDKNSIITGIITLFIFFRY